MVTSIASDTFTGTDGAAWSSTWANGELGTGASFQIQSNAGRITTASAGGYAGASTQKVNISNPTNQVWLMKFRWPSGHECYPGVWMRATNDILDANGGYAFQLNRPGSEWEILKFTSYSGTQLAQGAFSYASNTWYWVRAGVVGSAIKFKLWADGVSEPGAWTAEVTDATYAGAGRCGIRVGPGNAGSRVFEIDDFNLDDDFQLAFSDTGVLTGSGGLAASGVPRPTGTPGLSGAGVLVASGTPAIAAPVALTGAGSLTLPTRTPSIPGAAVLTGSGAVVVTGTPAVNATPAVLASDTFTGTDGAAFSSLWTTGLAPSGGTYLIQSNKGRFTGGTTAGTYQSANRVSRRLNMTAPVNAVALFSFTWPTLVRQYPSFWIRSTNTALDGQGGYRVLMNADLNTWNIGKSSAYTGVSLPTGTGSDTVSKTWVAGTKYWCRFGVVGSTIAARIWTDGDPEPGTWHTSATDTTHTTAGSGGGFSMGAGATSGGGETIDVDDFQLVADFPQPLLFGSGALTTAQAPGFPVTAARTGAGTLTVVAGPVGNDTAARTGAGVLVASGAPGFPVSVAWSGAGTLDLTRTPAIPGAASQTGSGVLEADVVPQLPGSAPRTGAGVLAATGIPTPTAIPGLSGTGVLAAVGAPTVAGALAGVSGSGQLSMTGVIGFSGTAARTGAGVLSAAGSPMVPGAASLAGVGVLGTVRAPRVPGTATASGSGGLVAVGVPQPAVVAALGGTGTLTLTRTPVIPGTAGLSAAGTLTVALSGQGNTRGTAALGTPPRRIRLAREDDDD